MRLRSTTESHTDADRHPGCLGQHRVMGDCFPCDPCECHRLRSDGADRGPTPRRHGRAIASPFLKLGLPRLRDVPLIVGSGLLGMAGYQMLLSLYLTPVVALPLSAIWVGDVPQPIELLGGALAIARGSIANRRVRQDHLAGASSPGIGEGCSSSDMRTTELAGLK
jgi:hypothetical protein